MFQQGIFYFATLPFRKARSRNLLHSPQTIFVASDVPDGNWDKFAAVYMTKIIGSTNSQLPVFLPKDNQLWAPFWEAIGTREINLVILGSKERFSFTEDIWNEVIKKYKNHPGSDDRLLPLPDYSKESPPTKEGYEHEVQIRIIHKLKLDDCFRVQHEFPKIILIMGESGPATLAGCESYLSQPEIFEPKGNSRKPSKEAFKGKISILKLKISHRKPTINEAQRSFDNRYVIPDSIYLDSQQEFDVYIKETQKIPKAIRVINRKIQLPIPGDGTSWTYYSPKKFILAYPNFKEIRKDEIFEGDNWRVRWGWKRDGLGNTTAKNTADKGYWTRIVFLSGKLIFDGKELWFCDPYLFIYEKGISIGLNFVEDRNFCDFRKRVFQRLTDSWRQFQKNENVQFPIGMEPTSKSLGVNIDTIKMWIGRPTLEDSTLIDKLVGRLPDPPGLVELPQPVDHYDLSEYMPFDIYIGSGLSYEAGVPSLHTLHEAFYVDNKAINNTMNTGSFIFAPDDLLIQEIERDFENAFLKLLNVDISYIVNKPSKGYDSIRKLKEYNFIHKVYTDNVDDLLLRAGVKDIIRTRGNGVLNEYFDVSSSNSGKNHLSEKNQFLWVVGVSADRRGIIQQARELGKIIVVINPNNEVSPNSKRLDYLQSDRQRSGDIWIKECFENIDLKVIKE